MRRSTPIARAAFAAALLLLVASCARTPPPAPPPPPTPPPAAAAALVAAPPPPAVQGAWDELPIIEGGWTYNPALRAARFVDASGLEQLALVCVLPGRTMRLVLAGEDGGTAELMTSAGRTRLTLSGGAAELAVGNAALDQMAFSRGRFGLQTARLMVIPVQAEIGRVIEDCRG